jgi:hypothetical protein
MMGMVEHKACIREMRNAQNLKIPSRKDKGKISLTRSRCRIDDNIKVRDIKV